MMGKRATFKDAQILRQARRERRSEKPLTCNTCGGREFEVIVHTRLFVYPIPPSGMRAKEIYGEKEQERVFSAALCADCGTYLSPGELTILIGKI